MRGGGALKRAVWGRWILALAVFAAAVIAVGCAALTSWNEYVGGGGGQVDSGHLVDVIDTGWSEERSVAWTCTPVKETGPPFSERGPAMMTMPVVDVS